MRVDLGLRASGEEALWRRGSGFSDPAVEEQGPGFHSGSAGRALMQLPLSLGAGHFPATGGQVCECRAGIRLGVSPALFVRFACRTPLLVLCKCGPGSLEIKRYLTFNRSLCETI